MFICLLIIPFCKAANDGEYESWYQAVQDIPNWLEEVTLDLSDRSIKAVPPDLDLLFTRELYLAGNQIAVIPNFRQSTSLDVLDLGNNQIAAIPDNFNPIYLDDLYLHSNYIKAIPADLSLNFLKVLDLSGNQIEAIPALNSRWLEELYFENNKITAIPESLELSGLKKLGLSENDIEKFDPKRLLKQFPNLEWLNLSSNPRLDPRNIQDLEEEASAAKRTIEIIADDILPEGQDIKGD